MCHRPGQGNRKDTDKERRFVLAEARTVERLDEDGETSEDAIIPISEEDGNLVIRFDYKSMPKGSKQDALVDQAVATILADETVKTRWLALTERAPTDKNPQRTLLEKCLTNYTQKNSSDYFIHKDLGGFLRRELDFYIKNEVMNLDDVQNAGAFGAIEKNLRMIQCLRAVALHLITFLASIEDFQKKLWLKKKFVVSSHYCVTLDRVPEELYPAIAANPAQWTQWHELGMRGSAQPGSVVDIGNSPYLMVDTALFSEDFRAELLKAIRNHARRPERRPSLFVSRRSPAGQARLWPAH
jgi:adenine-specific DNA-methyltransferase